MLVRIQIILSIKYFLSALLLWAGVIGCTAFTWASNEIKVDVVTHPGVAAVQNNISKNALRAIFGMRLRTWSDGSTIKVFVLSDNDLLHQSFSKEKLNIFPYQLRSAWDRLVYSGMGQSPIKVNSEEEMLAKVAETPGAIGYIWREYVDESINVLQLK